MTTLNARDKGVIALPEGQVLMVTGFAGASGLVRRIDPVIGGANYVETWPVSNGALAQIGPYTGLQQFYLTCTVGIIDAVQKNALASASADDVIATDSSTFLFGDSTVDYGNSATAGASSISHVQWCNDYMRIGGGVGFDVIGVSAVGGATIDDVLNLQLAAILASPAQIAWGRVGVNNFNSGSAHNDPVSVALSKMKVLLDALSPAKKLVIVDFINPVSQSGSTSAKGRASEFLAYNAGLAVLASTYPNVIANDTHTPMLDPASDVLNPLANMVRTDDGIHYVTMGAQNSGYASFRNISPRVRITRYKTKGPNLLPDLLGTGGTITPGGFITVTGSGVGVGWEVLGVSGAAATHSLVISDVAPDKKRLTFSNTGGADAVTYLRVSGLHTQVSGGMTVQGNFTFAASGLAGLQRLNLSLRENGGLVWDAMAQNTTREPTTVYPQRPHSGCRATPPHVLPALTAYEYIIPIRIAATTGVAVIDITEPEFYTLT